jgi:hypothetical protein
VVSAIASGIDGGRPVRVDCNDETAWAAIAAQSNFEPTLLGVVPYAKLAPGTRLFAVDAANVYLSPDTCQRLNVFAAAAAKPTKCPTTITVLRMVDQTERYRKKLRYRAKVRVRVQGRLVTQTVWKRKLVWRTRVVSRAVATDEPGPTAPCYNARAGSWRGTGWDSYWRTVRAIQVLAHESTHLTQSLAGRSIDAMLPTSETQAECYGMQSFTRVATQLGDTPDDAQALARFYYDKVYPLMGGETHNGSPYWSADCRENGPLDLSPNDGIWP